MAPGSYETEATPRFQRCNAFTETAERLYSCVLERGHAGNHRQGSYEW